ncbi:hypothetical protein SCAR479_04907 [Seiridium cardinale]|uniref:Uncharacterized protein n=1 Tax=Seiridium cardinale TaxID=138064 RepID=A0ABR2Y4N9_9PEZI
MVSSASGFV